MAKSTQPSVIKMRERLNALGVMIAHKLPGATVDDLLTPGLIDLFADDDERTAIHFLLPATVQQCIVSGFGTARDEQRDAARHAASVLRLLRHEEWEQLALGDGS